MTNELLPRFMLAENPMADPDGFYIIHTQTPRFIAKKVEDDPTTDFKIVMEIDSFMEAFQGKPERMAGLMRRMGDWYVAYCRWEDENFDNFNDEEDEEDE